MNDLQTLHEAEATVVIPVEMPDNLSPEILCQYAHTPYIDETDYSIDFLAETNREEPLQEFSIDVNGSKEINMNGKDINYITETFVPETAAGTVEYSSSDSRLTINEQKQIVVDNETFDATITATCKGLSDSIIVHNSEYER